MIEGVPDINLNTEQAASLKNIVKEHVDVLLMMDAQRDKIKSLRERIKEEFKELGVSTDIYNKVVAIAYKENGSEVDAKHVAILDLAEQLGFYEHDTD